MTAKCGYTWANDYRNINFATHPRHECGEDENHEEFCICKENHCMEVTFR